MSFSRFGFRFTALGFAALMLAGCAGGADDFLEPAEPTGNHPFPVRDTTYGRNSHEVHGIDIAKYQGNIDWQQVKASGIGFAFIKATEGTDRLDHKFQQNWAAAKAAGLPRGAYHFNYWCSPMRTQFEWFRRHVPRDPDAMPPVLDLEWNTASPTCPRRVSRAKAQAEIREFVRLAEAWYGKRPILYTDIRFYRDVLSDGSFSQYPLWVRATGRLPHEIYPGRKWAFWQYSDRSRVPGIRGHVDKNVFAGSRHDWHKLVASNFAHKNVVTPAAKPAPEPAAPQIAIAAATPQAPAQQPKTANAAAQTLVAKPPVAKTPVAQTLAAQTLARPAPPSQARAFVATGKPLSLTPIGLPGAKQEAVTQR